MKIRFTLAALLLAAATTTAAAQDKPQTREGFSASFGLGMGSAGLSCDGCDFDRETGLSGYLRLGGYIRPNLLLAGETNGYTKSEDGVDGQISYISAVAQYYPQVQKGFYVKGGLGLSMASIDDGTDEITANGMALSLGLGYDFRVGKNFSLTPYMNWLKSFGAEAELNGTGTGVDLNTDVLQFGLGLTWH
jgi:opacity protein-like surface antigen